MDDYTHQLFPYLQPSDIVTLSCGHVIPESNLCVSPVLHTSSGREFDFTFASRNSPGTMVDLGESLVRMMPIIPDGVVVFFPSYAYLDQVIGEWKKPFKSGNTTIWSRLGTIKPLFVEIKSGASSETTSTEEVLAAYSRAIDAPESRGALLFAVIGGKLSEGINFSDRLGRCVIVVGLPYPNPNSPEWKAKMEYIESKAVKRGVPRGHASREFAENVCMRAVNQAIGRAVRHKEDWASILLIDKRYGQKRITDKLPKWIQASLSSRSTGTFSALEDDLRRFYAGKKIRQL
jgi:chromosome transmission fidelity protein 1